MPSAKKVNKPASKPVAKKLNLERTGTHWETTYSPMNPAVLWIRLPHGKVLSAEGKHAVHAAILNRPYYLKVTSVRGEENVYTVFVANVRENVDAFFAALSARGSIVKSEAALVAEVKPKAPAKAAKPAPKPAPKPAKAAPAKKGGKARSIAID